MRLPDGPGIDPTMDYSPGDNPYCKTAALSGNKQKPDEAWQILQERRAKEVKGPRPMAANEKFTPVAAAKETFEQSMGVVESARGGFRAAQPPSTLCPHGLRQETCSTCMAYKKVYGKELR